LQTLLKAKGAFIMNSKDVSSKIGSSSVENNKLSNKNVTHTDHRSKTASNSVSNDPFYTPPGEGPKPRITSN
jgi:hypothetical protein